MKVALALGFAGISVALVALVLVSVVFVKSIAPVSEFLGSESPVVKAQSFLQFPSIGEIHLADCVGTFGALANFEKLISEPPQAHFTKLKAACLARKSPVDCVDDKCDPIQQPTEGGTI